MLSSQLFDAIINRGSFPEEEARLLLKQLLSALAYCHALGVVHRDLKPENVLFEQDEATRADGVVGSLKLIDFGYAGLWAADKPLTGLCGTPDYVAPEVLTWYDDDNGTPYGKGSDLWSLGVLLYVILSGCSPFSADEEEQLLKQVAEAKYEFFENEWKNISKDAKDIISRLLVVDPAQRLTMSELLVHPWVKSAVDKCRTRIEEKAAEEAKSPAPTGDKPGEVAARVASEKGEEAPVCAGCVIL